jgi:hypothetical protein
MGEFTTALRRALSTLCPIMGTMGSFVSDKVVGA